MPIQQRDFLATENKRNRANHRLYERFLRIAVDPKVEVLVAHHIVYLVDGQAPNEIPSADALMFDGGLMTTVFGDKAKALMLTLVSRPWDERDPVLDDFLQVREAELAAESARLVPA